MDSNSNQSRGELYLNNVPLLSRSRKWKFHQNILDLLGYGMLHFLCFIPHTHTHSRQLHIDGIVMTRTCLIRPGLWQGSRSDRDSSIIQRVREPKRPSHAWGHGRNSLCGWLLGHRCGRKWELFLFFLSFPPPL